VIQLKVEQGLSATRIRQDLRDELGIEVSYYSVRRFVQKLADVQPLPFRRMECDPGEEAQVDFGTGAPVIAADGKRRRVHVFRIVLSHSRKAYSEATFTQTTEDFFRCLENAFAHFGGVPKTLVIDNLKAAVLHPDWFDPELTPKVQSFCQHYGTVILPTKSYTPRHKGKVESGVKYVKNNALKGRTFASLEEENQFLGNWEANIADTRIHGTTKKQVGKVFQEIEQTTLLRRPLERFASFHEARRRVNRDGHIEVAKAYYSVPPEYLGREVWVRWDSRLVRVFNHRWQVIITHVRQEPGRFSTHTDHIAKEKISGLERGASWLLSKVSVIGPYTRQWSEAMLHARGIEGTRVLQGLVSLTKKHPSETLEKACEIAASHGCYRLRTLRQLLTRQTARQTTFAFLDEHPVIRPMTDYAAVVAAAHQRRMDRETSFAGNTGEEGFGRDGWAETRVACTAHEKSLAAPLSAPPGSADLSPPRPGYPSPRCSSAELGSVSPDTPTVLPDVRSSTSDSETSHE
jgi:transposase